MSNELTTIDQPSSGDQPDPDAKNVINYNPVFPVMTASVNLDLPVEDMAQDLLQLASDTVNYDGGYTTYFNKQRIDHIRGFKQLEEAIYGVTNSFLRELKYEVNPQKCSIHSWASVIRYGGSHGIHNHPRSVISGTYYIQCDEKSVPLVIENPTNGFRMHDPMVMRPEDFTAFTAPSMTVQPKPNMMVIWPSWLYHYVPKVIDQEARPRIAISFNVDFLPPGA